MPLRPSMQHHPDLFVTRLVLGELDANCYVVSDRSGQTGIVDPGGNGDYLCELISQQQLRPQWIALTHGHSDHHGAVLELCLAFPNLSVWVNPKDHFLLGKMLETLKQLGIKILSLSSESKMSLDSQQVFSVISTPGHTPGSCTLMTPALNLNVDDVPTGTQHRVEAKLVLTGDTLFANGVGEATRRYSDPDQLTTSVKRIQTLKPPILFGSGHGDMWLIANSHSILHYL